MGIADEWVLRALAAGMCLPFMASAVHKAIAPAAARLEFQQVGLPRPAIAVGLTIALQATGSVLAIGAQHWMAALGAASLAGFTVAATLLAHRFWRIVDPSQRAAHRNAFIEHLGLAFSLLALAWLHLRS